MKCTKCDAEIDYKAEACPYCNNKIKKDSNKTNNENKGNGCLIGVLVFVAIIFIPMIIIPIIQQVEISNEERQIEELTQQGKIVSAEEFINEIIEIFKNKDENKLKEYIAKEFVYYDSDNRESKYLYGLLSDIKILTSSYEIEKRGNSVPDWETFRIYWDIVESNKQRGTRKDESTYCLQKITVMIHKVVKQDFITYEIEKIILTDN